MKMEIEFDLAMQPAETTLAELRTKIAAFIESTGVHSLQLHEIRRTKTRKLEEAFLTWGDTEMTQQQVIDLLDILEHQFGLVGYVSPTPEQLFLSGLDPTAGLTCSTVIPGDTPFMIYVDRRNEVEANWANQGGILNSPGAGSNSFYLVDNQLPGNAALFMDAAPFGSSFTLPKAATLTLKKADGSTLTLKRDNDIVLDPSMFGFAFLHAWITKTGDMYIKDRFDTIHPGIMNLPFADAIANPALYKL